MKRYYSEKEGKYYYEGNVMTHRVGNGLWGGRPTAEQLAEWGYVEVVEPVVEQTPYVPTYEELVVQKIRERYSIDDEFAILRQKEEKPDEYSQYYSYCEACKAAARAEVEEREEVSNDD